MEIELTVAGGTGLAISANTFPVCSDDARQTAMDGTATATARATGSTLSDDVAPAKAGATEPVRSGTADDAPFPVRTTTGRAYPRTSPAGAAWPAIADMPPNGRTSVIASGNAAPAPTEVVGPAPGGGCHAATDPATANAVLPALEGRAGHPTSTSGQLPLQFPPLALSCGGQPRPQPVVVIRHVTSSARSCPQPARSCPGPRHTRRSSATRPSAGSQAAQSARPSQRILVSRSADLLTVSLRRSALIRRPAVPHNRGRRPRRASEVRHRRRASWVAPTDALLG